MAAVSQRQPDWDIDKSRGEEAEGLWRRYRSFMASGRAEVKRDDLAEKTGRFYIEYECCFADGWKPSGVATTKAELWVIYTEPVVLGLPTWVLRMMARKAIAEKAIGEQGAGSHPTRGALIPILALIEQAYEIYAAPI